MTKEQAFCLEPKQKRNKKQKSMTEQHQKQISSSSRSTLNLKTKDSSAALAKLIPRTRHTKPPHSPAIKGTSVCLTSCCTRDATQFAVLACSASLSPTRIHKFTELIVSWPAEIIDTLLFSPPESTPIFCS